MTIMTDAAMLMRALLCLLLNITGPIEGLQAHMHRPRLGLPCSH